MIKDFFFDWVGTCSSLCMYVRKRKTKSQLGCYIWLSQNLNRPADWMNECDLNSILVIKWDNIINIRLLVYTYHYYQHCFVIVYTTTIYLYIWTYLVHWVLNAIVLYTKMITLSSSKKKNDYSLNITGLVVSADELWGVLKRFTFKKKKKCRICDVIQ